jgi:hypothetical protein
MVSRLCTGSSGLLAIHVVQMLIYKNSQAHKNSLPRYQFPAELILSIKHEHTMRNDDDHKGDKSDEIWCDPFWDKLE